VTYAMTWSRLTGRPDSRAASGLPPRAYSRRPSGVNRMTNAATSVTTSAMITTLGTDPVRPPKMSRKVRLLITISVPTCTRKATPRAMLSMARVATNGAIRA
jgi:hypothetical protein